MKLNGRVLDGLEGMVCGNVEDCGVCFSGARFGIGHEVRLDQVLVLQAANEIVIFGSTNNAAKGGRSAGEHSAGLGLGR